MGPAADAIGCPEPSAWECGIRDALRRVRALPKDAYLTLALPVAAPPSGPRRLAAEGWFLEDHTGWRLGIGTAAQLQSRGPGRLPRLAQAFERWRARWRIEGDAGAGPAVYCGFGFGDEAPPGAWEAFPQACCVLPRVELASGTGGTRLYVSFSAREWADGSGDAGRLRILRRHLKQLAACFRPGGVSVGRCAPANDDPGFGLWCRRLRAALAAIQSGSLRKLVLARRQRWNGPGLDPARQPLARLAAQCPGEVAYAVRCGGGLLLGRSPERLVSVAGNRVVSEAVAGTAPATAAGALERPRLREEHAWVAEAIEVGLAGLARGPVERGELEIRRAGPLVHWCQPLSAPLSTGSSFSLLDAACVLHPTPAVAGYPGEAARRWLAASGDPPRGWYSGAVGWMDRQGRGTLSVVLRCALVSAGQADLYAGAGVVAGARAQFEWRETDWKLRQVASLLGLHPPAAVATG